MTEPLMTAFAILALMASWSMAKRTMLDSCRDHLFALRRKVRQWHIEHNKSMASKSYKTLRDIINARLRYTEEATVWGLIYCRNAFQQDPDILENISNEISSELQTEDKELEEFIRQIRIEANDTMNRYMAMSSITVLIAVLIFVVIHIISQLCKTLHERATSLKSGIRAAIKDSFIGIIRELISMEASEGAIGVSNKAAPCHAYSSRRLSATQNEVRMKGVHGEGQEAARGASPANSLR